MSWFKEKRQESRRDQMTDLVDWAMKYGTKVFFKKDLYNNDVWCSWPQPEDGWSILQYHQAAEQTISNLEGKTDEKVAEAHRLVKRIVDGLSISQEMRERVDQQALEQARSKVMIQLINEGKDDSPLFTAVAAATSFADLQKISRLDRMLSA